ncbi:MAG TPA: hypothetical protein VFN35_10390 [Ktedonobacteraceae bacterium]|nr:hypothetical protein [Ktedonobacteraceae bacterium]
MPLTRTFLLLLVSEHQGTGMDGSRTGAKEITYNGDSLIVEMNGEPG